MPFDPNYFDNLPTTRCKKVSRFWAAAIKKHEMQDYAAEPPYSDIVERMFRYISSFTKTDLHHPNLKNIHIPKQYQSLSGLSPVCPFKVFKHVHLRVNGKLNFFAEYSNFLQTRGNTLFNLHLNGDNDINISPSSFYMVLQKALQFSPNLKGLSVTSWLAITWTANRDLICNAIDRKAAFCDHKCIENISFRVDCIMSLCVQDRLLGKYSAQLKTLEVLYWNCDLYPDFQWTNLNYLSVLDEDSEQLLPSLLKMQANELRVLHFRLYRGNHHLETLIRVVNSFPKLRLLQLSISYGFTGWSDQDIFDVPVEVIGNNLVPELEIMSEDPDMCHNFLICFPALKKIIFNIGNRFEKLTSKFKSYLIGGGSKEHYIKNDHVFLGDDEPDLIIAPILESDSEEGIDLKDVYERSSEEERSDTDSEQEENSEADSELEENREANSELEENNETDLELEENSGQTDDENWCVEVVEEESGAIVEKQKHDCYCDGYGRTTGDVDKIRSTNTDYGRNSLDGYRSETSDARSDAGSNSSYASIHYSNGQVRPSTENDFIQISKYMWKSKCNMDEINRLYQSNIWECFRHLNVVEMRKPILHNDPIRIVCTKSGYEFWKNRNFFLDKHLREIQQLDVAQDVKRKEIFRKEFLRPRSFSARKTRSTEQFENLSKYDLVKVSN